jgi:hypothetical protein
MRMMYKYRKGKLEAKGIPPTLKHIIFFRSALARAVSLQPLIYSREDANIGSMLPSQLLHARSLERVTVCNMALTATLQSHRDQMEALLLVNADLHERQLEQDRKMKELQRN